MTREIVGWCTSHFWCIWYQRDGYYRLPLGLPAFLDACYSLALFQISGNDKDHESTRFQCSPDIIGYVFLLVSFFVSGFPRIGRGIILLIILYRSIFGWYTLDVEWIFSNLILTERLALCLEDEIVFSPLPQDANFCLTDCLINFWRHVTTHFLNQGAEFFFAPWWTSIEVWGVQRKRL